MSVVVNYEKNIMKCIDAMGIRVVKWQGWIVERWAFSRTNIPPCLSFCMSSCKQSSYLFRDFYDSAVVFYRVALFHT